MKEKDLTDEQRSALLAIRRGWAGLTVTEVVNWWTLEVVGHIDSGLPNLCPVCHMSIGIAMRMDHHLVEHQCQFGEVTVGYPGRIYAGT